MLVDFVVCDLDFLLQKKSIATKYWKKAGEKKYSDEMLFLPTVQKCNGQRPKLKQKLKEGLNNAQFLLVHTIDNTKATQLD